MSQCPNSLNMSDYKRMCIVQNVTTINAKYTKMSITEFANNNNNKNCICFCRTGFYKASLSHCTHTSFGIGMYIHIDLLKIYYCGDDSQVLSL